MHGLRELLRAREANGAPTRLEWTFPGHGQDCGISGWMYRVHFIGHEGHGRRAELGCIGRGCPSHYHRWAKDQARRLCRRLHSVHWIQAAVVSYRRRAPEDTLDLQKLFRQVYCDLKRVCGADVGGLVIMHHTRLTKPDRRDPYDGVHFHCLVSTRINPKAVRDLSEERYGEVIIKGLGRLRSLRAHLEYILSHSAVPLISAVDDRSGDTDKTGIHVIRWFGSWVRLRGPPKEALEIIRCKICRRYVPVDEWWPCDYDGPGPPPEREWVRAEEKDWRVRWEGSWRNEV